jgi:rRNA maturation protein Nop10
MKKEKYYCDLCGKQVEYSSDLKNIELNTFAPNNKYSNYRKTEEKDVCEDCRTKIQDSIDSTIIQIKTEATLRKAF